MQLSSVHLNDPESVWFDDSGRSAAYFCKNRPVKVDSDLILELKKAAKELGGNNVRLCLHENIEATFHEMINLEYRGRYYRPHKHPEQEHSFHLIEGNMGLFVFDEEGRVTHVQVLDPAKNFLYRIGVDMYHAVLPLTELSIYHESKPGPFVRETDSIFPSWAPDGTNPDEVSEFNAELQRQLENH